MPDTPHRLAHRTRPCRNSISAMPRPPLTGCAALAVAASVLALAGLAGSRQPRRSRGHGAAGRGAAGVPGDHLGQPGLRPAGPGR